MKNSKEIGAATLPEILPLIYEEDVRNAVRHLAFETDTITVKAIAREIGKADTTAFHKLSGETTMTIAEFCRIVRLGVSRGEMAGIDLMLPDGWAVIPIEEANGSIESEVTSLVQDAGSTVKDVRSGHSKAAERAAERTAADAGRLVATVKKRRR